MRNNALFFLLGGVYFLLISCNHAETDFSSRSGWNASSKRDSIECVQAVFLSETQEDQAELEKLNVKLAALSGQYGITETRSGDWNWPKFWTITVSDAVGAVVGGVAFGWWGALGVGVGSSVSSYISGKKIDNLFLQGNVPASPSANGQTTHFFATTTFVGYDENGLELSYDDAWLDEVESEIDIEDEIRDNLGQLHNMAIIALCQQYGDSLATFSNQLIIDRSLELVASWYGIDYSEIPYFDSDYAMLEACILEEDEDFVSLADSYPEYAAYFPIIENYYYSISQLETAEDILSYEAQATSLIQSSSLSAFSKEILCSGLDVMISSNGLWIKDDRMAEVDASEEEEEAGEGEE